MPSDHGDQIGDGDMRLMQLIGTCSKCGGPVTVSDAWYGTPSCDRCHAVVKNPYGPVIETIDAKDNVNPHPGQFEWKDMK